MSTIRKERERAEPTAAVKAYFESTPWAAAMFNDPTLIPLTNEAQVLRPGTTAETMIGRTLATDDTIRAWQQFYKRATKDDEKAEYFSLLALGSGVNGYPDTCHGGFVSLVLDEVVGMAASEARPMDKAAMTASLKVDYRRPVRTPGVILCRSWIDKVEGRKAWAKGTIEDGKGTILADGLGLFVVVEQDKVRQKL